MPRVRYGRVVLQLATWQLDEHELDPLTKIVREASKSGAREPVANAVQTLRAKLRLPRWLVIAEGDNELPIDLDNPLLVAVFADELAGQKRVKLQELFCAPDRLVVHGPEGKGGEGEAGFRGHGGSPGRRSGPKQHMALRERMGREASPSAAVLDSQSIKSAEKGAVTTARWVTTPANR